MDYRHIHVIGFYTHFCVTLSSSATKTRKVKLLASFYGIIIVMYLRNKEHNPPHVHAITQEFDAPFLIASGEIMDGEFPLKAKLLVKEFILKYQKELEEMWETEEYRKLPPLN